LIEKYLGSVVPIGDNYFSALNSAVFSDGSFVYVPKGVRSPIELSTYFRINDKESGQFERTLIIAEDDSYVSYSKVHGAAYDRNQLHAAVVELIAKDAPRSNTRLCRTGTRVIPKQERGEFTISSPSGTL